MATLVRWLITAVSILILADVVVSFVLDPFHPLRRNLDALVRPMLAPIRRFLPPTGMVDFSPFVLLILVQLVGALLLRLFSTG